MERSHQLTTNVTDSPLMHHELLTNVLRDRIDNLEDTYRTRALCYVLTKQNTLMKKI